MVPTLLSGWAGLPLIDRSAQGLIAPLGVDAGGLDGTMAEEAGGGLEVTPVLLDQARAAGMAEGMDASIRNTFPFSERS